MARGGRDKQQLIRATCMVGVRSILQKGKSWRFYKLKQKELNDHVVMMHRMNRAAKELVKLFICKVMDTTVPLASFSGV